MSEAELVSPSKRGSGQEARWKSPQAQLWILNSAPLPPVIAKVSKSFIILRNNCIPSVKSFFRHLPVMSVTHGAVQFQKERVGLLETRLTDSKSVGYGLRRTGSP